MFSTYTNMFVHIEIIFIIVKCYSFAQEMWKLLFLFIIIQINLFKIYFCIDITCKD